MTPTRRLRGFLLLGLAIVAAGSILSIPPIPQDTAYHRFADHRRLFGVPNLLNVLTNAPFLILGALGLVFTRRKDALRPNGPMTVPWERRSFQVLFSAMALTGVGSAYYHLAPDNRTLFWDRLPMTIVFMTLSALIIAERVSPEAGRWLFPWLLTAGIGSVVYWRQGELQGAGDLRFYYLVQFFPMLAIPLMLLWFPPRYTRGADLIGALGWYLLAKLFERLDRPIFALGGLVSGHTLKHLTAALSMYWILRMLRARRPYPP